MAEVRLVAAQHLKGKGGRALVARMAEVLLGAKMKKDKTWGRHSTCGSAQDIIDP